MSEGVALLRLAIERKDWDTAALCLLLAVARTASRYAPEVIEAMIGELAGELDQPPRRRRRGHRGRK